MIDRLGVGNNMAVHAPLEDKPFCLMLVVDEALINPNGNNYVSEDVIFSHVRYERLKEDSRTYLLRNNRESNTVYNHLVFTSKFSLSSIVHSIKSCLSSFELQVEVRKIIE
jgi:hypothetical protein